MEKLLITYYGHSCFKINYNGYEAVFDPYNDNTVPGLNPLRISANYVLISHFHSDHDGLDCVSITPVEESPFEYNSIMSNHDSISGNSRGKNLININYNDVFKIAHLGDLGHMLDDKDIEKLKDFDVIMVPVGGYYTIDSKTAIELIKKINAKLSIIMHFRTDTYGYDEISTLDEFKKIYPSLEIIDTNIYEYTKNNESKVIALTVN